MKRMKQALLLLMCAALLLCGLPLTAAAQEPGVIVSQAAGRRGETVTVAVQFSHVEGVAGGGFNLTYNPGQLTLLAIDKGELMNGCSAQINPNYEENQARVSFAGVQGKTMNGTLVEVRFKIAEGADLGDIPVTLDRLRLYDENSNNVPVENTPGGVTVKAAAISLTDARCLAGQAVKLDVMLGGTEAPCGGKFEIVYNTRMLRGGSIKEEQKLGDIGITLSYKIDEDAGRIKISWAAAEPLTELGKLCTVIFAVSDTASGSTDVRLEHVKFLDEETNTLDQHDPQHGTVTVVSDYNPTPTLYVVGGSIREDGTAVVNVSLDGAGLVCGGRFNLSYDESQCTLLEAKPMMGCVAINSQTTGGMRISWAEDSAALDHETILQLTFQMADGIFGAPLTLSGAVLKDSDSATMTDIVVHSGSVGLGEPVQPPIVQITDTEDAIEVRATLYDARFCTENKTEAASALLASYTEDGRFIGMQIPDVSDTFDHNGIAQLELELPADADLDGLKLFVLEDAETFLPLSRPAPLS